ncbi:PucR C-terminal helix-turn-helix domain-containing protein [Nonomuraea solani]|uniref:PucR C-terminal helix-turn-helix domain-containing protein n=1 Tax=Nonomuraea solani TaxID=1144553 RepID=A0A1H6ETE3_9ACTN|nr:helix-turn-helix domain-containing protein [Nonomuraea solani]SEH01140.1 PucR C-terminal helix-turn-helix domain-containing protein [Nonomuraea solani]
MTSEARAENEWLEELVRELRRQAARESGPDLARIVGWLGRRIRAEVALVDEAGAVELATPGFPQGLTESLEEPLGRLSRGQVATAATEAGALRVRCEALGAEVPRPVLVVVVPETLTSRAAGLVTYAGSLIAVLRRVRVDAGLANAYQHKAAQVRVAVFMALMAGDPTLARRLTSGAVPALLEAQRVRVLLLRCPPDDRDRHIRTYQDLSGYHGRGLMLRCPVYDDHLICLTPDAPTSRLVDGLRHLIRDNAHYTLGGSSPQPLAATAQAYHEARHALAVARNTPGRIADYRGPAPLEHLLPREPAEAWARSYLRPLRPVPALTIDITRLAVTFPRVGVARLLGIGRNSVTAHLKRVEAALGIRLDDVGSRATLALALAITSLYADSGTPHSPPSLEKLLRTQAATTWARTLLAPIDDPGHQKLYRTLTTWIQADTDTQRTAGLLGISRNTVTAHLRTAERLLNRDLLSTRSGIHDLVYALRITTSPDESS